MFEPNKFRTNSLAAATTLICAERVSERHTHTHSRKSSNTPRNSPNALPAIRCDYHYILIIPPTSSASTIFINSAGTVSATHARASLSHRVCCFVGNTLDVTPSIQIRLAPHVEWLHLNSPPHFDCARSPEVGECWRHRQCLYTDYIISRCAHILYVNAHYIEYAVACIIYERDETDNSGRMNSISTTSYGTRTIKRIHTQHPPTLRTCVCVHVRVWVGIDFRQGQHSAGFIGAWVRVYGVSSVWRRKRTNGSHTIRAYGWIYCRRLCALRRRRRCVFYITFVDDISYTKNHN